MEVKTRKQLMMGQHCIEKAGQKTHRMVKEGVSSSYNTKLQIIEVRRSYIRGVVAVVRCYHQYTDGLQHL